MCVVCSIVRHEELWQLFKGIENTIVKERTHLRYLICRAALKERSLVRPIIAFQLTRSGTIRLRRRPLRLAVDELHDVVVAVAPYLKPLTEPRHIVDEQKRTLSHLHAGFLFRLADMVSLLAICPFDVNVAVDHTVAGAHFGETE